MVSEVEHSRYVRSHSARTHMESLDLSHNQISHVEELEKLTSLSSLNLGEYLSFGQAALANSSS